MSTKVDVDVTELWREFKEHPTTDMRNHLVFNSCRLFIVLRNLKWGPIMRLNWMLAGAVALMPAFQGTLLTSQVQTQVPAIEANAKPDTVEHIKVHGKSLEGNLEGEAVDRDVIVFLPPSYQKDKHRRYPVVYALHGYSIGAEQWTHEIHVPQTIEGAIALGSKEMIVVLPDSKTIYNGSMYSSSQTTGDFENYVAHDVVAYIDEHYRTIADRQSRGLVGHSMGGYGASRIGMKHPDVFGALYIMSPCCMSPMAGGGPPGANPEAMKERAIANEKKVAEAKSPADLAAESPGFGAAQYATAAAWAPDPKNPPLYFDLPTKDGVPQPDVHGQILGQRASGVSSTNTSAISSSTAPFPWTWGIRTVCGSTPPSCTTSWTATALPMALRSTTAPTPAQSPTASRTT